MTETVICLAKTEDLGGILEIYADARKFMAENGNPTQWNNGYPKRELLELDIRLNRLFVMRRNDEICGTFVFFIGDDPTYQYIEGSWMDDASYGVIHRIAGNGGGIFAAALDFCRKQISHIRIDTHHNNIPMQRAVEKAGFSRRGIIYVEDGTPRIAYEKV